MAIKLDNIHIDYRGINGYNKPFNVIVGPREPGKTTRMWIDIYTHFKATGDPSIYMVRQAVEICEALINSIADTIINKFFDDNVTLTYTKGEFKTGITDVYIKDKLFFRIVSLNISLRRIKLAVLKNIYIGFMDEYIIDPKTGEKYLQNEAFKIKEAYTTWRREASGVLKFYFTANPYSLYNPLFLDWKVDVSKLKPGAFVSGENYVIQCCTISPELKEHILKVNPLYKFDDSYKNFALEGVPVNDKNILLSSMKDNYYLKHVFKIDNHIIGVYQARYSVYKEIKYFCKFIDPDKINRDIYVFDIEELVSGAVLVSLQERRDFNYFKNAMRFNKVEFDTINEYYLIKELYKYL